MTSRAGSEDGTTARHVRDVVARVTAVGVALAVLGLGATACGGGTEDRLDPDLRDVQAKVAQLRLEVHELRTEVAELRDAVTTTTTPETTSTTTTTSTTATTR